jgi:hypothetical protein
MKLSMNILPLNTSQFSYSHLSVFSSAKMAVMRICEVEAELVAQNEGSEYVMDGDGSSRSMKLSGAF